VLVPDQGSESVFWVSEVLTSEPGSPYESRGTRCLHHCCSCLACPCQGRWSATIATVQGAIEKCWGAFTDYSADDGHSGTWASFSNLYLEHFQTCRKVSGHRAQYVCCAPFRDRLLAQQPAPHLPLGFPSQNQLLQNHSSPSTGRATLA
jgi:hypothetical protein